VKARKLKIPEMLDRLEAFYGPQEPSWPLDPYLFLVWWHCGYPASDATCQRGWDALKSNVGVAPRDLLKKSQAGLAAALKAGGMVPEVRAARLQEIAGRVLNEFGGSLRDSLVGSMRDIRKLLKSFPGIADPGADRILLFGDCAPVAAIPSNCPHVLVRIQGGSEQDYGKTYREAQSLIEAEVPAQFASRQRAFLLLKQHGQSICKRTEPKCGLCPVNGGCGYFTRRNRNSIRLD